MTSKLNRIVICANNAKLERNCVEEAKDVEVKPVSVAVVEEATDSIDLAVVVHA